MSDTTNNNFTKLAAVNVNQSTKKKGQFTYLSWAFALEELMRLDPLATWVFHEPMNFGETMMVSCTLTAFEKPVYMWLPVIDHRNAAIKNPDAMAVNKAMMRCLVKAIAAHGLGLYIYAGEDLPSEDDVNVNQQQAAPVATQPQSLTDDRFAAALGAVEAGSYDKALLLDETKFRLTDEQKEALRGAPCASDAQALTQSWVQLVASNLTDCLPQLSKLSEIW